VSQLEILPEPPAHRLENNPWPTWPVTLRSSAAHEEGGDRLYSIATSELVDDGTGAVGVLRANRVERVVSAGETQFRPIAGAQVELAADLVLLALGFVGPELNGPVAELGCARSDRGTLLIDASYMTSVPGVFACGDAARGQSLIVWAIAEGRSAAAAVDRHLMGASDLPFPLAVGAVGLS
jgi:glutamate synthase (NADPH/NADH) small chain